MEAWDGGTFERDPNGVGIRRVSRRARWLFCLGGNAFMNEFERLSIAIDKCEGREPKQKVSPANPCEMKSLWKKTVIDEMEPTNHSYNSHTSLGGKTTSFPIKNLNPQLKKTRALSFNTTVIPDSSLKKFLDLHRRNGAIELLPP